MEFTGMPRKQNRRLTSQILQGCNVRPPRRVEPLFQQMLNRDASPWVGGQLGAGRFTRSLSGLRYTPHPTRVPLFWCSRTENSDGPTVGDPLWFCKDDCMMDQSTQVLWCDLAVSLPAHF